MELEKSWAAVMHKDHADFSDYCKDRKNGSATQLRRQRSKPLWRVREHMAFLIRNLQFYIQVKISYYLLSLFYILFHVFGFMILVIKCITLKLDYFLHDINSGVFFCSMFLSLLLFK
jgi:hypothetical protein